MSTEERKPDVARVVDEFVNTIDGLAMALSVSTRALLIDHEDAHKKIKDFIDAHGIVSEKEGKKTFKISSHEFCHDFGIVKDELDRLHAGMAAVPRGFFVAMVSQYDAFLGSLVSALIHLKPELLNASGCTLTYADLLRFGSLEAARDFVVENELETLLRKSHAEQFKHLENKFAIELRKGLPEWTTFVELTERRNLLVHADGVASNQYIANCRENGVKLDETIRPGVKLELPAEYFRKAYRTLFQIGIKLSQVLWRKIAPQQAEDADSNLAEISYNLLRDRQYRRATAILDFADTVLAKRHTNEKYRLMFLVNRALVYYLRADKSKCAEILDTQDWTATSLVYQLAEGVLRERFDAAAEIVTKIGADSYPHKADYLHWPLFTDFRKTPQFTEAFKNTFGDEVHEEEVPGPEPSPIEPTVQ
jgi:hypothetical protein